MVAMHTKTPYSDFADNLRVLVTFLVGGLTSGVLFAWAHTRPSLQPYWYLRGDQFTTPRYTSFGAFTISLVLGLASAYCVALSRQWLTGPSGKRWSWLLAAGITIGAAAPVLYFLSPLMHGLLGMNWYFTVEPLVFLALLSLSLCLLTRNLRLLPLAFAWNVAFAVGSLALVYAAVHSSYVNSKIERYEFVTSSILGSMVGLSFGAWLVWRERLASRRNAAHDGALEVSQLNS
jgi:hypothetical protein